eukprot:g2819.t1
MGHVRKRILRGKVTWRVVKTPWGERTPILYPGYTAFSDLRHDTADVLVARHPRVHGWRAGRIPELQRNVAHMTGMMPWCNGDNLSDPFKLFCGNPQYGHAFLKLHENLDKITVPHWACTDTGVKATEATLVIAGGGDGGFAGHWGSHCIVTEHRTQYFGDLQRRLTEGQCFVPFREGSLPPLDHIAVVHAFAGAFLTVNECTSLTRWAQQPLEGMDAHPHWAGPLHCYSNAFEGEHPIAILQRKFRARRERTRDLFADMFYRRCTIAQRRGVSPVSIVI